MEMWEGRDNPACLELPQDQLWQVPLAPPEDILSWLSRIGLLADDEDAEDPAAPRNADMLLDDEYDLDEMDEADGEDLGVSSKGSEMVDASADATAEDEDEGGDEEEEAADDADAVDAAGGVTGDMDDDELI